MHVIAYTSEFIPESGDEDAVIDNIVKVAKAGNAEHGITGVLFFHEGRFLQLLEGEEADLRTLMGKIENDNRHKDVKYLIDSDEQERSFGSWSMGEIQLGKGKHFDAEYLEKISKSFEKYMVPDCSTLAYFYKTLLAERKRILGIF